MDTVVLQDLSKTYPGGKQALRQISLSLEQGEVFGFLGPNGAGKTTTVKLLNGMLAPSQGKIRVLGLDPAKQPEKIHALSGVVTEHAQMYDHMTGMQNLIFYASVFGMPKDQAKAQAESLLGRLDLMEARDRKLAAYSTGMRQRLSLARALIHRPQVLFLDEPTSGLDPESAQRVNRMIRELAQNEDYWSTPTGWYYAALKPQAPDLAQALMEEFIRHTWRHRELGAPFEFINRDMSRYSGCVYATSAALPYAEYMRMNAVP